MVKIEIEMSDKLENDVNKIKPNELSIEDFLIVIIKNEINSRFDDLFNYSTFL